MQLRTSRQESILTFVAGNVGTVYLFSRLFIPVSAKTSQLAQAAQHVLLIVHLLAMFIFGVIIATSPAEAHVRDFASHLSLRLTSALCILIDQIVFIQQLRPRNEPRRISVLLCLEYLPALALFALGAWQYILARSQWLWLFIPIASVIPASVAVALSSKINSNDRPKILWRLMATQRLVPLFIVPAIVFAIVAGALGFTRAPLLNEAQFSIQYSLGVAGMAATIYGRNIFPPRQSQPTESTEALVDNPAPHETERS